MSRPYFAGDGCHRLALLLVVGVRALEPETYKVKICRKWSPLDYTHSLIRLLDLNPRDYLDFVASGYSDRSFQTRRELRDWVATNTPERLGELDSVIAADTVQLQKRM